MAEQDLIERVRRDYARASDIEDAACDAVDRIRQVIANERLTKRAKHALERAGTDICRALGKDEGCGISAALAALRSAQPQVTEERVEAASDAVCEWLRSTNPVTEFLADSDDTREDLCRVALTAALGGSHDR